MDHIIRYGSHADKKFINQKRHYYDYMTFNANIVAYSQKAVTKFVNSNLLRKGFFIDPQTHAYQYSIDNLKNDSDVLKKSYSQLIEAYGETAANIVIDKDAPLIPTDFTPEVTEEFVRNVLLFQYNTIHETSEELETTEFLNEKKIKNLRPQFLICPYFVYEKMLRRFDFNDWSRLNKKLIQESIKIKNSIDYEIPLMGQIVLRQEILEDETLLDQIVNNYSFNEIEGVLIWIDDFNENEISRSMLLNYCSLLKKLYDSNLKVYNLYGGFFSTALGFFENELDFKIDGVVHGLAYNESRKISPVGGGIPSAKYYFFNIHKRLRGIKVLPFFHHQGVSNANQYLSNICDCNICKNNIFDPFTDSFTDTFLNLKTYTVGKTERRYASQETKANNLIHYLNMKNREIKVLDNMSMMALISLLNYNYNLYSGNSDLLKEINHLQIWKEVFIKLSKSDI